MGEARPAWGGAWSADGSEVVGREGTFWVAILGVSKNSFAFSITSPVRPAAETSGRVLRAWPAGLGCTGSARVAANVGKRDDPDLDTPCPRALHTAAVTVSCMLTLRAELCSAAREMG